MFILNKKMAKELNYKKVKNNFSGYDYLVYRHEYSKQPMAKFYNDDGDSILTEISVGGINSITLSKLLRLMKRIEADNRMFVEVKDDE